MNVFLSSDVDYTYSNRVKPQLEALGVDVPQHLTQLWTDEVNHVQSWGLLLQRPAVGSVIDMRTDSSNRWMLGDTRIFMEKDRDQPFPQRVRVESCYGLVATVQEFDANLKEKDHIEWESHPMVAFSSEWVTILTDLLPGKDSFVAIDVWANSSIPIALFQQKPVRPRLNAATISKLISTNVSLHSLKDDVQLAIQCEDCRGNGYQPCPACNGEGVWQPDGNCMKCEGTGSLQCDKCDGYGEIECRKCSGSGVYHGHNGYSGTCNSCSGTGTCACYKCDGKGVITCYACQGSGEPPILTCKSCSGEGQIACNSCRGSGSQSVNFFSRSGKYICRGKVVDPAKVGAFSRGDKLFDSIFQQGAYAFRQQLVAESSLSLAKKKASDTFKADLRGISECLDRAMEASGTSADALDVRDVQLVDQQSVSERSKGFELLSFRFTKTPPWAKRLKCPLEPGTPLNLATEEGVPVEIPSLLPTRSQQKIQPEYHKLIKQGSTTRMILRFRKDADLEHLPELFSISADIIPPAELVQKKELMKWCSSEFHSPIIECLLEMQTGGSKKHMFPQINAIDPSIQGNPMQQEALNAIMSENPLVLVKGPPGTGKTTVIIESVLQCISKGQKVLICSETHQAVANVLERLARDKNIRILRHARSGNPKLSSIEEQFLEDSSSHGFVEKVRDRVDFNLRNFLMIEEVTKELAVVLSNAIQASTSLLNIRIKTAEHEKQANTEFHKIEDAIIQSQTESESDANRRWTKVMTNTLNELNHWKDSEVLAHKRLTQFQKDRASAADTYIKKSGKYPSRLNNGKSESWYKPSSYLPNWLSSTDRLCNRYTIACENADEWKKRWILAGEKKQAAEELLAAHKDSFREEREGIAAEFGRRLLIEKKQNIKILHRLKNERKNAEDAFLPPQEAAIDAWKNAGLFPVDFTRDQVPDTWESLQRHLGKRSDDIISRIEFLKRWKTTLESNASAVVHLFLGSTQVFMSTCVGLASWRTFHQVFGSEGIDLVIIDEAAHATLTQTLIPMSRGKRTILIGDEMQLPPSSPMNLRGSCEIACLAFKPSNSPIGSVNSSRSVPMSSCWLERSAFEWIIRTRQNVVKQHFKVYHPSALQNVPPLEDCCHRLVVFADQCKTTDSVLFPLAGE